MNGEVTRRVVLPLCLAAAVACLNACGRHGVGATAPSQPVAGSVPSPAPVPAASPSMAAPAPAPAAPENEPAPAPSPDCIHDSDHAVDRVSLAVYFLECGGERIPGSRDVTDVPVGCRIHFNATPRDGSGAPTCSRTWPDWQVGPEDLVTGGGGDTFTPAYTAKAVGRLSARCIVDGVRSDWVFLNLVEPR
jgi:hypothetical protein